MKALAMSLLLGVVVVDIRRAAKARRGVEERAMTAVGAKEAAEARAVSVDGRLSEGSPRFARPE